MSRTFDQTLEDLALRIAERLGKTGGGALPVAALAVEPLPIVAGGALPIVATGPLPIVAVESLPTVIAAPVVVASASTIALRRHELGDPGECCDMATEATLAAVLDHLLGCATEDTLSDLLNRIPADLDPGTQATLADLLATARSVVADGRVAVRVTNLPAVQPVTVASLPLPAGAASEVTLAGILAALEAMVPATHLAHITTAGTRTLKVGTGVLRGVTCNGKAGIKATIYNGVDAGGEVIAEITANGWAALPYEGEFTVGLTIVTTGTWDLTVAWK